MLLLQVPTRSPFVCSMRPVVNGRQQGYHPDVIEEQWALGAGGESLQGIRAAVEGFPGYTPCPSSASRFPVSEPRWRLYFLSIL